MDAGQLTTYAWLLPTWPNWQSPSKLLFPTCWHSWYTVSTSVLSQFLGMHAGKSGWFFYQLEIVLFTEFPDSLALRMSPGVSPWESHSLGQVPMCWLHSSSSGHTMVLTNANCCPSCVKQFLLWIWILMFRHAYAGGEWFGWNCSGSYLKDAAIAPQFTSWFPWSSSQFQAWI